MSFHFFVHGLQYESAQVNNNKMVLTGLEAEKAASAIEMILK
jgi:hypothetical protein